MSLLSFAKVVLRNASGKPATRLYPIEKREPFEATRGHVEFKADTCIYCTLCAKACPTGAIVVNRASKTWQIDVRKCILCQACVESCRKDCITLSNRTAAPLSREEWLAIERDTQ